VRVAPWGLLIAVKLFLEGIGLDANEHLLEILGGQEDDGGCCRRHVGGLLDCCVR